MGNINSVKKVLMAAYVFPPMAYAGTYRTLRFCRYLPEKGWIPYVLTIKEADDLDNDYKLMDQIPKEVKIYRTRTIDFWRFWNSRKENMRPAKKAEDNERINRNRMKEKKRNWVSNIKAFLWELVTIPDHMVFWVPFAVLKGIQILRKEKCDLIYTSSPPHSEQIIGFILSKLFKRNWVADFRDPILDSSGYNPTSRLRLWIDRYLEKLVVKNADKVIVISERYREIISMRYTHLRRKFITLPNGFDPEVFDNISPERFDKFTIIYSGSFYANRKPDFFLKGFKKWFLKQPTDFSTNIQVIFYGSKYSGVEKIVSEEELESVIHLEGVVAQDIIIPKLKGAHLLLLIIGFDQESRGVVTSKIFEYMACNRPILGIMPEGEASRILQDYGKFYWVNREDEGLLAKCLDKAFEDYLRKDDFFKSDVENGHLNKIDPYDARIQSQKLSNIFFEAISG